MLNLVFAGALVVYQFSQSLLLSVFVFPIMESASYLGESPLQAMKSIVLISFFISATVMFYFGTLIA